MDSKYHIISYNKEYLHADSVKIELSNRAFRYGDGFFETMHANGLEVQFLIDHYERIQFALKTLSLELPDYFSIDFLKTQISGLLSRSKLFQAARVKLTVFRSGEGLYKPTTNKAEFVIEAKYLGKGPYELNTQGIKVGLYKDNPKPNYPYFKFKSLNSQLYTLATIYAQNNALDDVLLINGRGAIVEGSSSNVFAVKDRTVYTPSLNSGCVHGIMRKQILGVCCSLAYKVEQNDNITEEALLEMDEIFLTNAVVGLKYISAFRNKRYYNRNSKKIIAKLNELAF